MFPCEGARLVGIAHLPVKPSNRAVVIVVGGPQYRLGSHRQFVLLARQLAEEGYCVLRFDCRGMGDSEGEHPGFENLQPDIRAAIDALFEAVPSLTDVVLWGLCDAASAALLYVKSDQRVSGVVLLNPWVHDSEAEQPLYLRDYYLKRLRSAGFWKQLLTGKVGVFGRLSARLGVRSRVANAISAKPARREEVSVARAAKPILTYQHRMYIGAREFEGRALVILSGEDLVAMEFKSLLGRDRGWKGLLRSNRWRVCELDRATHTFSREEWRDQVANWTLEWLAAW